MKQKFCLFILFTAISLQSFTQTKWTLEDCINYAHANNLQVKRQQLQADMAKNNYNQSYFNFAPNLNGGISRSYGHVINPATNTYTGNTNSTYDAYYLQI